MSAFATVNLVEEGENLAMSDMVAKLNEEDRKRFERMDIRLEDVLKRMDVLASKLEGVERTINVSASKKDVEELLEEIDTIREKSTQTVIDHETRLRMMEKTMTNIETVAQRLESETEGLKEWKWKQIGFILGITTLLQVLAKVFWH